jgi:hypothetical protein
MIIDIPKLAGKSPETVKKALAEFQAVQLRSNLLGGRPGSEWRFTDSKDRNIEITFEKNRADMFLVFGQFFDGIDPTSAAGKSKILEMIGFRKMPPPNVKPMKNSRASDWENVRGFSRLYISVNMPRVMFVGAKVTPEN